MGTKLSGWCMTGYCKGCFSARCPHECHDPKAATK